jgi:HK97 family phage prohead protease
MPDIKAEDEGNVIEGHAAVIGQTTSIGGLFYEVIDKGAFDKTDFRDVLFSVNHNIDNIPLARSRNNNASSTLRLMIDDIGLYIRASLDTDNNSEARALYSAVQRQDITGMSFIFVVRDEYWESLDSDMPTRHITDIAKVIETSAVSFPAYENTDISSRSVVELDGLKQMLESKKADYINTINKDALEERRKAIILKTLF